MKTSDLLAHCICISQISCEDFKSLNPVESDPVWKLLITWWAKDIRDWHMDETWHQDEEIFNYCRCRRYSQGCIRAQEDSPTARERASGIGGADKLVSYRLGCQCEHRDLSPMHVHIQGSLCKGWTGHLFLSGVKRIWAVIQTWTGKGPCCTPWVWVWALRFRGSNGSNGQEPPSASGCPHTQRNWADNLMWEKRKKSLSVARVVFFTWQSYHPAPIFFYPPLLRNSVAPNPGCLTEPPGILGSF